MKNKSSDNTSNIDSSPERNQEPTEKGEIKLLDVVVLTQDVPEHNLKRGEVGTVVEILANGEAYEVEFSDDNGQMSKCLSFPASQLRVIHDEPIKADPKRQATDSIEGYRYQILHSVNAWLDLADNDILYLEVAEDFDIESDRTFTTTQVKHTQDPITLRSQQVIDGINNYWELRTNNPDRRVKFRLLTKSKIGKEQGNLLETDKPGLEVWSRCSGDEAAIEKISNFLQTDRKISEEVNDFLKVSSPQEIYEQLIEPITWETDGKPSSSVEQSIREKLLLHGNKLRLLPFDASKVINALLNEAFTVATHKQNRELNKTRFFEIFEEQTTQRVSTQHLRHLQMQATQATGLDTANAAFIGGSSDVTIQPQSPIQNTIPPLYRDVFKRTELLTSIQTKFQSEGIVIIQGSVDTGKTTLAKLTANNIDSDWFWLKFTDKEASQIVQDLQQLANAVSTRSAQVNVILDDLNLQPQQLREYEEDLGVVVYMILERGAKLLITSQYNPPNNLIRNLGLSSSIVVHVSNFTIPEIEKFATEMGCPAEDAKDLAELFQLPTKRHPRLVHALFSQLREKDWKQQDIIESIFQSSSTMAKEFEDARQLLADLSEDQREFLYRLSLMITEFRKDCALNIGEIPKPISHPGHTFSQLAGPWIDQVSETYYTISPLLTNAAKEIWSDERKIKDLHAYIANAILKTKKLTTIEAWAVFTHSMIGENKGGLISVIHALMTSQEEDWKNLCQEFSWLVSIKTDPHEELFPGDAFVNQMFRSLQYRIAVEVRPELVPKILEIWDKETKPYKPRKSYLLSRLMLATEILKYNQVLLPAKKTIGYIKEMTDIKNTNKDVWEMYLNSMGQIKEHITDNSNLFSFLFSFIYMRPDINAEFLDELIDALDELEPRIRTLLLAEFEDYNVDCRILIESIYLQEEKLENPDWTKCLQVYDKVIERSLDWRYPHIAALSARGKAIIHDEYLKDHNTAHQVYQDIILKVGALPVIEEGQAVVYLRHGHYQEALDIYERILPEWHQSLEQFGVGPLEEYRRAAICAAYLDDWKEAATFFEEGAKKTQKVDNTERCIGSYADAGFAHFKAGNMLDCIKLLNLALQKFETLPQNNTDVTYFTLKKRLACSIGWIAYHEDENYTKKSEEPFVGFCSNPETNEEVLNLPDSRIEYIWLALARIECKFGHGTTVLEHTLQITNQNANPRLRGSVYLLETQYDFRNKTFNDLPQRIHQLANVCRAIQQYNQSGEGIKEKRTDSLSIDYSPNLNSVKTVVIMLISALLAQLPTNRDIHEILAIWRVNSSGLPIKDNMITALDLIESMLFGNQNHALTTMKTQEAKLEKRLVAALKIVHDTKSGPNNLFYAHILITTALISETWEGFVEADLVNLLSTQWLKKIKFPATLKTPMLTVPQIEKACNNDETGKKKIGQILLAVHQAVSLEVSPDILQQFRSWSESESTQQQEPTTEKNPTAQSLITAMEKPPHLTDEDVEVLHQSIEEGKIPIKFDSPFEPDEQEKE